MTKSKTAAKAPKSKLPEKESYPCVVKGCDENAVWQIDHVPSNYPDETGLHTCAEHLSGMVVQKATVTWIGESSKDKKYVPPPVDINSMCDQYATGDGCGGDCDFCEDLDEVRPATKEEMGERALKFKKGCRVGCDCGFEKLGCSGDCGEVSDSPLQLVLSGGAVVAGTVDQIAALLDALGFGPGNE